MAGLNQDRGVGADILRQLMSVPAESLKMLLKAGEQITEPIAGASRLAGTASVAPAEDVMQPRTRELVMNESLLKAAKAKISKGAKETTESMTPEQAADIVAQGETMMNQQEGNQGSGQIGTGQINTNQTATSQPTGQEGMEVLSGLMKNLGNFIYQQGGVDDGGLVKGPSMFGGFIQENPRVTLARQQAQALSPAGAGAIKKAEAEAALPSEIMKERVKGLVKMNEEGMLKPKDLFEGFRKDSGEFLKVRDAHGRVENSAQDPSAAGDLALIFNYMKVLDPGSTVREGEFATAQEAASFLERKYGKVARFTTGGRLSPKTRADFVDRSRRLFKGMESQQKQNVNEYKRLAEANNLDFERLIMDTGLAKQGGQKTAQTQPGTKQNIDAEYERYLKIIGG